MRAKFLGYAIALVAVVSLTNSFTGQSFAQTRDASHDGQLRVFKYGIAGGSAADLNIYVGLQLGYFAKHGLDLQTVTVSSGSATDLLSLVAAGAVQMEDALPDPVVAAGAHTANFKIVNKIHTGPERLVARAGITTIDQIKSLDVVKVAVSSPTTSIAALSRFMLEQNGVPAEKVQFVVLGGSAERLAALKTGAVDVSLLIQPSDFVAIAAGLAVLADSTQPRYAPYYGNTDISSASVIKKDCGLIRRYYAAIRDISAFTKNLKNEPEVVSILAKSTKTSPAIAQSTINLYKADDIFPDINDPTATVVGTAKLTAALGTKVADNPASLVDTSCIQ